MRSSAAAASLACAVAIQHASAFVPAVQPSRCAQTAVAAAGGSGTENVSSWREKVDLLLNPRLSLSERQILTKDLLNDLPEIRDDVQAAATKGGARAILQDVILSPGSEARRAAAGLRAVQRQLRDDILPELQKELRSASSGGSASRARINTLLNDELPAALEKALKDLPSRVGKADLSPQAACKAADAVREEVLNAVSRTPEGLYTPPYEVLETGPVEEARALPAFEIRKYGAVSLATATMSSNTGNSAAASGDAFNTLAGYLFGGNSEKKSMQMTMPVTIDVARSSSSSSDSDDSSTVSGSTAGYQRMSFVLPEGVNASDAPSPVDGKVMLRTISEQTVAAREFTGFATANEVKREVEALRAAIAAGGKWTIEEAPEGAAECQLLQYNPPYAVPWVRRNEVVLRVKSTDSTDDSSSSESSESAVAADAEVADVVEVAASAASAAATVSPSASYLNDLDNGVKPTTEGGSPTASYLDDL